MSYKNHPTIRVNHVFTSLGCRQYNSVDWFLIHHLQHQLLACNLETAPCAGSPGAVDSVQAKHTWRKGPQEISNPGPGSIAAGFDPIAIEEFVNSLHRKA